MKMKAMPQSGFQGLLNTLPSNIKLQFHNLLVLGFSVFCLVTFLNGENLIFSIEGDQRKDQICNICKRTENCMFFFSFSGE